MIFYFFLAGALQYNLGAAAKSVAGIGVPNPLTVSKYTHRVYLGNVRAHLLSMVVRARLSKGRPGSVRAGTPTLFGLPPNGLGVSGGSLKNTLTEAAQWLLPFTVCTRNTFVPIRGCTMLYDPTPLTSAELTDHCCALAYAIIELNNPLAKELLMFMLWERLNMLSEELEIEGLADE
ncbi:ash family protein [Yersinia intermedia]|jgi:Ash protein family|uniref:ash family protein n=1 Tax=Yersinia intermedia TaxID=631 RepID=UPI00067BEABD|nr:ash family protein [Yersinia intermedia]MDA5510790.1 ash family protein [Yersinia intermedia]PNM25179.1 hypothetical protein A6J66_013905 [Yersinia enterocolitica]